ncbi:MAG: AAA family ATPase [Candidatus Heimdallarchaeota archaeon]
MKMVLAAVPGAGKSTVMHLIQKELPEINIVTLGDFMYNIAKKDYGIHDRDEMRKKLSPTGYRDVQERAATNISQLTGDVLIDTHLSIKTSFGYYPGLPDDLVRLIQPDVIVLLEFEPKIVLNRRKKDIELNNEKTTLIGTVVKPRAGRELENLEDIDHQQQLNRYFAVAAANAARCSVKIIDLRFEQHIPFEHAQTAAKELIALFKNK